MDRQYRDTVALLLDVTTFIFKQKCFAMKGGTAINLFCRDMPRLSVDIDLVYVDSQVPDRTAALAAIENSLRKIATELKARLGVSVFPIYDATYFFHETSVLDLNLPSLLSRSLLLDLETRPDGKTLNIGAVFLDQVFWKRVSISKLSLSTFTAVQENKQ